MWKGFINKSEEKTGTAQSGRTVWDMILAAFCAVLLLYFLCHPSFYLPGPTAQNSFFTILKKFALEAALTALGLFLIQKRGRITERLKPLARPLSILLTVLTPFISFMATNIITRSIPRTFPKSDKVSLTFKIIVLNTIIAAVILLLFLMLLNHMRAACMISILIGVFFCIANYFVSNFRGTPIQVSDFASFSTAMSVAGSYSYQINATIVITLQGVLVFYLFFRCLGNSRLFARLKGRLVFTAAGLAVWAVFVSQFVFSDYLKKNGGKFEMFKPLETYYRSGTYVTLLLSYRYTRISVPQDYSPDAVSRIAAEYPSDTAVSSSDYPNIIVVLNESFTDLATMGEFDTDQDYMPFFHSLQKDFTHGWCYCSSEGGNTANVELELLTATSIRLLPENAIAFQFYIKQNMPSLASVCESLGYQGILAMHPARAENYNRRTVYPRLGFQTFLSKPDFPEDMPTLRGYASDLAMNDMIIRQYEQAKAQSDAPVMFYALTIQNHGGYRSSDENFPTTVKLTSHFDDQAEEFLSLMKYSDEALEELVHYFEQVEEPTVILFMGDHQPRLPQSWYSDITDGAYSDWSSEEQMRHYVTPFVLWSNFDIPKKEYDRCGAIYLQSILFDACHLPMTGFQKYMADFMNDVQGLTKRGYWGSDGTFYDPSDTSSPYYSRLQELELLLYNNLFDPLNRPANFFELKTS